MTTANRTVTITMTPETLTALNQSGAWLYGFLAVQSSDKAGLPVVWLQTQAYSATTPVNWQGCYQAYTSPDSIAPKGHINAGFSVTIAPGQLLTVGASGTGAVTDQGPDPHAIAFLNTSQKPFSCGVAEPSPPDAGFNPVCAAPLYGNNGQIIVPLPTILLLFATQAAPPGTIVTQAAGPGLLIDLNGVSSRQVGYDINAGWTWGQETWGQAVAPFSPITPLLVQYSDALRTLNDQMIARLL